MNDKIKVKCMCDKLNLFKSIIIPMYFPSDFENTLWQHWVNSINAIKAIQYDLDPVYNQDNGEICDCECSDKEYIKSDALNVIQGSIFVYMWSLMERFLKSMVPYLHILNAELDSTFYQNGKNNFDFTMFKKAYKSVDIKGACSIKNFWDINDIRLLNNIFKHLGGNYNCKNKQCQFLSKTIKKKLKIDSNCGFCTLEYQHLDPKEYIQFCNSFANDVLDKIQEKMTELLNNKYAK